ncbi:phosphoglycerate dehydrogenase-like enzyme [Anaerotaenia torta]|uniref:hydroxyacid dehydrogenase n=1 Tax=Anaerotaenia torta TaxID=433293 RepID=UPI003D197476
MRLFIAEDVQRIWDCYSQEQVGGCPVINHTELYTNPEKYVDTEFIFSTWGMIRLNRDEVATYFPNLKAVFYAAGTVSGFAQPFIENGVRVFSAWSANAIPVAEYTAAQIILANKGFYQLHQRYKESGLMAARQYGDTFPGNYGTKVGLIGTGQISRHIIKLLQPYKLDIYVTSDYLTEEDARKLGVTLSDLDYIFENCQTISNHLANKPETVGLLNEAYFSKMKANATFINTGRGAQVEEAALIRAMKEEPRRTALLDVTDPKEPLDPDDPIWEVPNIIITPHRAGSMTEEIRRMGAYMLDEYKRLIQGEEPLYEITLDLLRKLA